MTDSARTGEPPPAHLVVIDDNAFTCKLGQILPMTGDFYRFAIRLGTIAGRLTLCSPVLGLDYTRPRRRAAVFGDRVDLVPTFPYRRVSGYLRRLPAALAHNVPALFGAIRKADLVLIRLPAINGPLAFMLAAVQRKPVSLFLVGWPAQGALTSGSSRWHRIMITLASELEWQVISWMARRAPVFAYGSPLARRLERSGAPRVRVTFTSLVEEIPALNRDLAQARARITVLYAGRFAPEKGIDVLLDAARLCAGNGVPVRVILAGDGPLAPALRRHPALASGLDVEFTGWLEDGPKLDKVFHEADIFVQPSRSEGIPKALLKAMAHGLPIVATRTGGIPDIVTDGKQGFLVPAGDPAGMAKALSRLAADPALRFRFGEAGRHFAAAHTAGRQADSVWREITNFYPHIT
jgi:glycosyltransferase involved in cell wall biosynthesis